MLNVVVLPEPFGPMRPSISPFIDIEAEIVDGDETAEAAREPVDFEHGGHEASPPLAVDHLRGAAVLPALAQTL